AGSEESQQTHVQVVQLFGLSSTPCYPYGVCPVPPQRWHGDHWIVQDTGLFHAYLYGVFVQDSRRVWFAGRWIGQGDQGVIALDDGGTPDDLADDSWTTYPISAPHTGDQAVVALDKLGRVWYGDGQGLARLSGSTWIEVIADRQVCDLVPADGGVMFVLWPRNGNSCSRASTTLSMVEPNGQVQDIAIWDLAANHLDLLQSATHPNLLWTVAPGGGVWSIRSGDDRLIRWDRSGSTEYALPFDADTIDAPFAVDANNHVWVISDGSLWRMSPRPDFQLDGLGGLWLLAPGSTTARRAWVAAVEGYDYPVSLQASGLPPDVTVAAEPNPVLPGSPVTMTVQAGPGVALGSYPATLLADSDVISHTLALTVTIASQVETRWLPLSSRAN
ncbi:MAG: hypothetical protein ACK2U9_19720, partial [Anaerolineae bacterium]